MTLILFECIASHFPTTIILPKISVLNLKPTDLNEVVV